MGSVGWDIVRESSAQTLELLSGVASRDQTRCSTVVGPRLHLAGWGCSGDFLGVLVETVRGMAKSKYRVEYLENAQEEPLVVSRQDNSLWICRGWLQ